MWSLGQGSEPNIPCKQGRGLARWLGELAWFQVFIFSSFIQHLTTHKKKYIVHALQMRYRNLFFSLQVWTSPGLHKTPPRVQNSLEVLHCWWSCRRRKGATCETKPLCLSPTGLLGNSCWIIYREHLHICCFVMSHCQLAASNFWADYQPCSRREGNASDN